MKKIFLHALYISFLLALNSFAQIQIPDVVTELLVQDNAGRQKVLVFGLDSTATDGIDINLEESDLPPFPPAGAFEARFFLPQGGFAGTLGSYRDFRQALLPFTGQKEFRLAYQPGLGTEIKVTWDWPENITGVLQDIIIGTLINVNMADSGSYTVTNPAAFNRLKMTINYVDIIPVELVSFNALVGGNSVILSWKTASELNNSGFEVQRKTENSNWNKIGYVQGAGTTTESRSYSFSDQYSGQGTVSYRLKQIDFDGTSTFSKVVNIDLSTPTEFKLNQNYPNPFNPSTTVSFSIPKATNVKLTIYNQIGQQVDELVNRNLESGSYNYTWNASKQSSGIYFYELQTNEFKSVRKMTLIK
ncbi:MAG: T9SS C-terminal target domain-containing protein [Ignavibacteriales bacterium]|nr:MAG: T9SS C-terminal target domain-containing protein [Ignavibacteriales bacterium]